VSPAPRAGVLGLGLIGGSLLRGLAAAGAEPLGFDTDPGTAAAAADAGFAVVRDAAELAGACDVVVVCVPPERTADAVAEVLEADGDVVVADAASVKAAVLAGVAARVGEAALRRFLPAHPLAGAAPAGWAAADPELLRGAPWAVCPPAPDAPPDALCAVSAVLDGLGARLLACDAGAHDAAVARTSHVPHLVAQALARAPADGLEAALTGGAYRSMTRTASAGEDLWVSILLANAEPAAAALRELGEELGDLAGSLAAGEAERLREAWRAGARARARVDALRWSEPSWTAERLAWPAWDALLALGRAGRAVRRVRLAGDGRRVELDVAAP
jgi:prephenate dehydrogenase